MPIKNKRNAPRSRKRRQSVRPRRLRPVRSMAISSNLARAVCSLADPFCPAAYGAKYPDSASTKTLAWTMETYAPLFTDANGLGATIISPDPAEGFRTATIVGSSVTAISAASAYPGYSNFSAVPGIQYRIVSMGVHAVSTLAAMNNSGTLGILNVPASSGTVGATVNIGSTQYSANSRVPMNSPGGMTSVPRNDGQSARLFTYSDPQASPYVRAAGWDIPIVYVAGGPANSTVGQIRVVIHYEFTFASGTVFNQAATPAAQENDALTSGYNFVMRRLTPVIKGGTEQVERLTMAAANSFGQTAFRAGATALGGFFGGPSGALTGYSAANLIMDVN